ncbi:MAG: hypothetical protein HGA19_00510 [Oscillochloris sp.]|nr:hypothetical protein [Oscillochloris sp.]
MSGDMGKRNVRRLIAALAAVAFALTAGAMGSQIQSGQTQSAPQLVADPGGGLGGDGG